MSVTGGLGQCQADYAGFVKMITPEIGWIPRHLQVDFTSIFGITQGIW